MLTSLLNIHCVFRLRFTKHTEHGLSQAALDTIRLGDRYNTEGTAGVAMVIERSPEGARLDRSAFCPEGAWLDQAAFQGV